MNEQVTALATRLDHLGPALVSRIDEEGVWCLVGDRAVLVHDAMPMRYRAQEGDLLLVIGGAEDGHWAIGVVQGRGSCELDAQGDLTLRSGTGQVRIEGHRGVTIDSPETRLCGRRVEIAAETLVSKAIDWLVTIRDKLQMKAKRRECRISETDHTWTGSTSHRSEGPVVIDGTEIFLG